VLPDDVTMIVVSVNHECVVPWNTNDPLLTIHTLPDNDVTVAEPANTTSPPATCRLELLLNNNEALLSIKNVPPVTEICESSTCILVLFTLVNMPPDTLMVELVVLVSMLDPCITNDPPDTSMQLLCRFNVLYSCSANDPPDTLMHEC
jgi:hypothetical protein